MTERGFVPNGELFRPVFQSVHQSGEQSCTRDEAAGLQAERGGTVGQRFGKYILIDVEPDAEDDERVAMQAREQEHLERWRAA